MRALQHINFNVLTNLVLEYGHQLSLHFLTITSIQRQTYLFHLLQKIEFVNLVFAKSHINSYPLMLHFVVKLEKIVKCNFKRNNFVPMMIKWPEILIVSINVNLCFLL